MEKLENTKPEKLLIAISALGNHGKTLSATRLIELLISHREGWLYDSRSINLKKSNWLFYNAMERQKLQLLPLVMESIVDLKIGIIL